MKKIVMTLAIAACAAFASAQTPAPAAGNDGAGHRAPRGEHRQQALTPEQRKERMERFQAMREERQKKVVEALREAGLDEAKAKEVAGKIDKIYAPGRPPRPGRGGAHRPRPEAK